MRRMNCGLQFSSITAKWPTKWNVLRHVSLEFEIDAPTPILYSKCSLDIAFQGLGALSLMEVIAVILGIKGW